MGSPIRPFCFRSRSMPMPAPMSAQSMTTWFIVIVALVITIYDVWQALSSEGVTITDVVHGWAIDRPWLPWVTLALLVFLWWHLFYQEWPQRR